MASFSVSYSNFTFVFKLALKGSVILVLPIDSSPEESLAGEAAVAAVVDMAHRAVAAYPTQNLGHVCIILARAAGTRATGGHLGLLARLGAGSLTGVVLGPLALSFLALWRSAEECVL